MLFILVGMVGLLNIHFGWYPQDHGISVDAEFTGSIICILIGVIIVQTDKIIEKLSKEN